MKTRVSLKYFVNDCSYVSFQNYVDSFFVFSADFSKNQSQFEQNIKMHVYLLFRKYYLLLGSELPLTRCQRLKIQDVLLLTTHNISTHNITISHERLSSKPINHTIFCKNSIRSFICILHKLYQIFCCYQEKIQKMAIFDILKTITPGVNMITRQITPFFSCTL